MLSDCWYVRRLNVSFHLFQKCCLSTFDVYCLYLIVYLWHFISFFKMSAILKKITTSTGQDVAQYLQKIYIKNQYKWLNKQVNAYIFIEFNLVYGIFGTKSHTYNSIKTNFTFLLNKSFQKIYSSAPHTFYTTVHKNELILNKKRLPKIYKNLRKLLTV